MNAMLPTESAGFGRAVRLAMAHSFDSFLTREQAAYGTADLKRDARLRGALGVAWAVPVLALWLLGGAAGARIGAALAGDVPGFGGLLMLLGSLLLVFLGAYGFMRLAQLALHALLDTDDPFDWPREGVDWGRQSVTLDRDGIAVAMRHVRRAYGWEDLAELTEDDVFVLRRRGGGVVVVPKDPDPETDDDMRERLFRGITLARPVRG